MSGRTEIVWDEPRLDSPHTQQDKAERVRKMFDQIAPTYELVNSLASAGRDTFWRRQMVRLAEVRPDDILLDIACGTGDVARTFAAATTRPKQIIGLDFSLPMLLQANHRPIDGGRFCQGDALRLPVADGSVSIVSCAFGIRNFQNLAAGLAEMHRVLGRNGRAVILEFSVPSHPLFRRLYLFYIRRVMPWLATLISRDRSGAYRYLPRSVVSFDGRDAILSTLKNAGFTRVTAYPFSFGIVAIYVACKAGSDQQ
jgi:demethylmenaquinone methyltransferase/2-methoxy-6-polyprenyl-1,4-benzoquinol methylase